jgi:hypothetical protein
MFWFAETLPKQAETLQSLLSHVVEGVCKGLDVAVKDWFRHRCWQEALCMVLVQITPKSNSMNVLVCSNPTQTRLNFEGHIDTCYLLFVQSFVCGLHGLVQPHVVAGSTLYGFSANNPKK